MASQGFTDDLKHVMRGSAAAARERLAALQRILRSALGRLRALPTPMKMKIGACAAGVAVLAGALGLRGEARTMTHRLFARTNSPVTAEAPLQARAAIKSYVAGSTEESHGEYKIAAQSYATASRQGDARGLNKLVAMTRAPKCEARSEAADALAGFRSAKATGALKKLAASNFKDEPKSPGIFSCSSRRAAQKALEKQGRGQPAFRSVAQGR
jgi:hypothetical protein